MFISILVARRKASIKTNPSFFSFPLSYIYSLIMEYKQILKPINQYIYIIYTYHVYQLYRLPSSKIYFMSLIYFSLFGSILFHP